MTPLQQLAALAALAAAVTSLPIAAPVAATRGAIAVAPRHVSRETARQIRANAIHALTIDIHPEYRQQNWNGTNAKGQPEGSCAWASLVNLLHWQGQHAKAERIRALYSAGAGPDRLYPAMNDQRIDYVAVPSAQHKAGDVAFLEWACRTRRGACVPVGAWCQKCKTRHACEHMINLVGIDPNFVYLLDNNGHRQTYRRSREDFLADWRESGGWAFTPLYSPAPPKPWILSTTPQEPAQ